MDRKPFNRVMHDRLPETYPDQIEHSAPPVRLAAATPPCDQRQTEGDNESRRPTAEATHCEASVLALADESTSVS